jgi:hypothetical protein
MCARLGITIIPASSSHAKGRIERHHGTHQDRLVKKLRRKGIAEVGAANYLSRRRVLAGAQPPLRGDGRLSGRFPQSVPARLSLDDVFRLEETRTVSNDWVVRYANRHFQFRAPKLPAARAQTVQVFENATGSIDIRYRDRRVRWTEIAAPARPSAAPPRRTARGPAPTRSPRWRPDAEHPWKRDLGEVLRAASRLMPVGR